MARLLFAEHFLTIPCLKKLKPVEQARYPITSYIQELLDNIPLHISPVKGGRKEVFPIGKSATELLKRVIGKRKKGFVFLNPKTQTRYVSIHKCFNKVVRKLNLTVNGTKLRFHDLRHVFCTWLLKQGVTIDVIRELVGHRNRSTTDRYATLNRVELCKYLSYLPEIKNSSQISTEAS